MTTPPRPARQAPARRTAPRRATPTHQPAPDYAAPALDKGLDILECLADAPGGLNLTGLCERLQRRPAEIFRMTVRLHERGYLQRDNADRYHLTAKLLQLAHRHPPTQRLVHTALPAMQDLAQAVGQSCHLAQLHQSELIVLAEVVGNGPRCLTVQTGTRYPAHQTASGHLLLALTHSDTSDPNAKHTPAQQRIRKQQAITQRSLTLHGVIDLACPIYDHHQQPLAALAVPVLLRRDQPNAVPQTLQQLQHAARTITHALGGHA